MLSHRLPCLAHRAMSLLSPAWRSLSVEAAQFVNLNAEPSPSILSTQLPTKDDILNSLSTTASSAALATADHDAEEDINKEPFVGVLAQQTAAGDKSVTPLPVPEPFRVPEGTPREEPAWMHSEPPILRNPLAGARQPLPGIRMEDPSLPLPRFTPTTRKSRPAPIDLAEGLQRVKAEANARFEESVEVAFNLGIDPRRGDQNVRGAVTLPHGTGKSVRVGVFAEDEAAELARAAGAEVVGSEDLIASIQADGGGAIPFEKCLATAGMMPKLARIARILGPRGLMPNPKLGTMVDPSSIQEAISTMKAGRVEYRSDRTGVLHVAFGKVSFPIEHLQANLGALTAAVLGARPKGLKGGGMTGYILKATLSSTMGRAVPITLASLQQAVNAATTAKR